MAFTLEDGLLAAAVVAASSGAIAASFHARGLGYSHHRRAVPVAAASAFFMLGSLALELYKVPGDWAARLSSAAQRPDVLLLAAAAVGAVALAWTASSWNRLADRGRLPLPDPAHPLVATLVVGLSAVALLGLLCLLSDGAVAIPAPAAGSGTSLGELGALVVTTGLAVPVWAAATAHALAGRKEWVDVALPWTRMALFAAWLGLASAALHGNLLDGEVAAVRTFAVLLWVPLVHGLIYHRKKRLMSVLTPFFGAFALPAMLVAGLAEAMGGPRGPAPSDRLAILPLALLALPAAAWLAGRALRSYGARRWSAATAAGGLSGVAAAAVARPQLLDRFDALPMQLTAWTLVAAAALGLLAAWASRSRAPPEGTLIDRWVQMGPLVRLGMWVSAVGLLAIVLLWTQGLLPSAKAGILAATLPVLLIMGVALSNQTLGRRMSLLAAALAVVAGLLLSVALREPGGLALFVVPVAGFALLGALLKLVSVSDTPAAPGSLRVAGAILFLGGIVGVAVWTGPELLSAMPRAIQPARAWAPLGVASGLLAIAGGISAQRLRHHRLALAGSVALALALPWLLPVALALLAYFARRAASFEGGRALFERPRGLRREFRKTGVYLIHAAVALLVMAMATGRLGWSGAWLGGIGLLVILLAGGASWEAPQKRKA